MKNTEGNIYSSQTYKKVTFNFTMLSVPFFIHNTFFLYELFLIATEVNEIFIRPFIYFNILEDPCHFSYKR